MPRHFRRKPRASIACTASGANRGPPDGHSHLRKQSSRNTHGQGARIMNLDRHEALIGGTWVPAGKVIDVDNHATGERTGSGAGSDQQLVEDAVVAAAAQRQWAALSPAQRDGQLHNLLTALRAR